MGNFAENLNLGNRFRPPPVFFVYQFLVLNSYNHQYKLSFLKQNEVIRIFKTKELRKPLTSNII